MKYIRIPTFAVIAALISLSSCQKLDYILQEYHHPKGNDSGDTDSVSTLTIQPNDNQSEVHLFGNSNGIDQSGIEVPEIEGGSGTYFGDAVAVRALVRFDLSAIPTNAQITSARLILFSNHSPLNGEGNKSRANSGSDNAIVISRVTDSWTGTDANWTHQPNISGADTVMIPHTDSAFLDLNIEVKELVQKMLAGNNGFQIKLQHEQGYNWRIFCSSKYTDATRHPKLEVSYTTE